MLTFPPLGREQPVETTRPLHPAFPKGRGKLLATLLKPRRLPLNTRRFQIGMVTVVLLVALRLALGCHFLYEGVWKIKHRDEFTGGSLGVLVAGEGAVAGVFYAMLPDIDGRERLQADLKMVKEPRATSGSKTSRWPIAGRRSTTSSSTHIAAKQRQGYAQDRLEKAADEGLRRPRRRGAKSI